MPTKERGGKMFKCCLRWLQQQEEYQRKFTTNKTDKQALIDSMTECGYCSEELSKERMWCTCETPSETFPGQDYCQNCHKLKDRPEEKIEKLKIHYNSAISVKDPEVDGMIWKAIYEFTFKVNELVDIINKLKEK